MLPSGSIVVLVRCERDEWVCKYTERGMTRGEVEFSESWLRQFGRLL